MSKALLDISRASRTASDIDVVFAFPVPTISKAVPWSGDVLINGKPNVTLTPFPKVAVLNAAMPTSW